MMLMWLGELNVGDVLVSVMGKKCMKMVILLLCVVMLLFFVGVLSLALCYCNRA